MKWKLPLGIVVVLALGVGGYMIYTNQKPKDITMVVHPGDFVQQVSVSGKVIPSESLDLSFEQSGRITKVNAKVGDVVTADKILASQDTAQLDAQLQVIQSNIDLQKARLNQFLSGTSSEDIAVAQTAVANAETSVSNAKDALDNAKQTVLDVLQEAYTKGDDAILNKADQLFTNPHTPNVQLNVTSTDNQLKTSIEFSRANIESILASWKIQTDTLSMNADPKSFIATTKTNLDTLKSFFEDLSLVVNNPNSCKDYRTSTCEAIPSTWKTDISTARTTILTVSNSVTSAEGAYKTATSNLKTAEGNLKTANDQLAVKKAPARSSDTSVYQAQVRQAEASKQDVLAQLTKRNMHAPINGVITSVDAKVGKIVGANVAVISMISSSALEIESYVPEKNLPFIHVGDTANVTLDAYGTDVPFATTVVSMEPAETIRDGVTTYKILLQFLKQDDRIKPGMTANVLVNTEKKANIISVPQGIIEMENGQKVVKVKEGGSIVSRVVITGNVSSLGAIEISSGLKDGDVVVLKQAAN